MATAEEAAGLRAAGIDGPLLVMGALAPDELTVALAARADIVVWREELVAALAGRDDAAGIGVHVKLDSGMGRLGTRDPAEAARVADAVAAAPGLRLAGAMTHFATADDDPGFAREQLARYLAWAEPLRARHDGLLLHAANSAATLGIPEARLDLVRCGIALYGMDPFGADPASTAWRPRSSCPPTSPRSSRSRRGRAPATAAVSSRTRRPGSGRSRSATGTASGAR